MSGPYQLIAARRSRRSWLDPEQPAQRVAVLRAELGDVEVPLRTVRLSMTEPSRTRTSFRDLLKSAAVLP